MYSVGQTYKLKPGRYADYKRAHDQIWPEVSEALAAHDISMAIYHWNGRLFLHAVAPSPTAMRDSHAGRKAQEWMAYMATLLETDESGQSIVEDMDAAFLCGAFAPEGKGT